MAENKTPWNWGNQQYYHAQLEKEIDEKIAEAGTGGGTSVTVDSALSTTSENPVQNKVVTAELNKKLNSTDIADWAKAENKPEYTYTEVGADPVGSASAAKTEANKYTDDQVAALVGSAPEILDTIEEVAAAIQENESVVEALEAAIGSKANKDEIPITLPANGGNADTVDNYHATDLKSKVDILSADPTSPAAGYMWVTTS